MAAFPSTTFTSTEATDWESGDYLRYDKFRDQIGSNIEYLKASVDAIATGAFWSLFEVRLQTGFAIGGPFA
jgi:hypothetical protein